MQNLVNFYTPTIETNNAFYIPGRDAKVSFVDVRDVATVAIQGRVDSRKAIST